MRHVPAAAICKYDLLDLVVAAPIPVFRCHTVVHTIRQLQIKAVAPDNHRSRREPGGKGNGVDVAHGSVVIVDAVLVISGRKHIGVVA